MKFVCLGYTEEKTWAGVPKEQLEAMIEECFAYDDELARNGHVVGGNGLQAPRTAVTLRYTDGKVVVTDGPYAETKEYLGGILILEARDMNHAIELMSKHPGVRLGGPFEIRPANEEIDAFWEARKKKLRKV
jgi:hypothetical protein